MPRPFNGLNKLTLMFGACSGCTPGDYFTDICCKLNQFLGIFIIHISHLVFAKAADSFTFGSNQNSLLCIVLGLKIQTFITKIIITLQRIVLIFCLFLPECFH